MLSPTKHHNDINKCPRCMELICLYPDFDKALEDWFFFFRVENPLFHITCAGRGKLAQESAFNSHHSMAHFGDSAHNYNAALDLYINQSGDIYNLEEFNKALLDRPEWLRWYGEKGSKYYELPHVEVKAWRQMVEDKQLTLVEED